MFDESKWMRERRLMREQSDAEKALERENAPTSTAQPHESEWMRERRLKSEQSALESEPVRELREIMAAHKKKIEALDAEEKAIKEGWHRRAERFRTMYHTHKGYFTSIPAGPYHETGWRGISKEEVEVIAKEIEQGDFSNAINALTCTQHSEGVGILFGDAELPMPEQVPAHKVNRLTPEWLAEYKKKRATSLWGIAEGLAEALLWPSRGEPKEDWIGSNGQTTSLRCAYCNTPVNMGPLGVESNICDGCNRPWIGCAGKYH